MRLHVPLFTSQPSNWIFFRCRHSPLANSSIMPVCVHLRSLDVTAAKESDYVFQGSGSEETLVSEDRSLWPLWPRLLPLGGPQKTQILNLLSFYPQACWCILQRSLQGSGGEMPFSLILVPFNTLTAFLTPPPFFCLVTVFLLIAVSCWVPGGMPQKLDVLKN